MDAVTNGKSQLPQPMLDARDLFAIGALSTVAAGSHRVGEDFLATENYPSAAEQAYRMANELIKARAAIAAQSIELRIPTDEELHACCGGCASNAAILTWMRRAIDKFCEINALASVYKATGGAA